MASAIEVTALILFWQSVQDRVRTLVSEKMNDQLEDTIIFLQSYRDRLDKERTPISRITDEK